MSVDSYANSLFADVSNVCRTKLNVSSATLPDAKILLVERITLASFFNIFPSLQNGAAIGGMTDADAVLFTAGLGTYCASVLKPSTSRVSPETPLIGVKLGTDEFRYSNPTPTTMSRDESLLDEAWRYLMDNTVLRVDLSATYNRPVIGRSGHRRGARKALGIAESGNPLYSIYANDLSAWEWERNRALSSGVA